MMLTVACVWVRGHVPYTSEYVVRLRSMVARNVARPHRFVCLSDRPELLTAQGVEAVYIAPVVWDAFPWWSKLRLFDAKVSALQSGRCVYLDLDTVVLRPLDPIIDYPATFAAAPDTATFPGKGKRRTHHVYNSSVLAWDGGRHNYLFSDFRPAVTRRLWGDQDWISERVEEAQAMPAVWFPRLSDCGVKPPPEEARVLLCKKPKNDVAARMFPWFKEAWA